MQLYNALKMPYCRTAELHLSILCNCTLDTQTCTMHIYEVKWIFSGAHLTGCPTWSTCRTFRTWDNSDPKVWTQSVWTYDL